MAIQMMSIKNILHTAQRLRRFSPRLLSLCLMALPALSAFAQGYDDDLYYDPTKAKKETPKRNTPAAAYTLPASGMYYYDGTEYVPWDSVGVYRAAGSYQPAGAGANRDVDEYNRRGAYAPSASGRELTDSMSLGQFEELSATHNLARFSHSAAATDALREAGETDYFALDSVPYTDLFATAYNNGYTDGYNTGASSSYVTVNINNPYGYYSSWDYPWYSTWGWSYPYPYYSWGYPYYSWGYPYSSWSWGWYPSWSWGWTSPYWAWSWYPGGYYPGGWHSWHHPSPSAAHRPRLGGSSYGNARPGYGDRYNGGGSSVRPGYRPPAPASGTGGYNYNSNRNSHYGSATSGSGSAAGYRPSGGSNNGGSGAARPSGSGSSNRGSFGAGNSHRNSGSYNSSGSSRSGSSGYSPSRSSGSSRSGGYSGGSRSGGGSRGGGGGHRSR